MIFAIFYLMKHEGQFLNSYFNDMYTMNLRVGCILEKIDRTRVLLLRLEQKRRHVIKIANISWYLVSGAENGVVYASYSRSENQIC